ncbi:MAG TPA: regulatory protein RecX [Gemmatimonadaceae bacterium]|nr:regulatory protein RecX [Gemmatimonadaceae bacterium]
MSIVTALTPHPRRTGRVDVAVDGKSAGAISLDAIARLGIHVGTDLDPIRQAFEDEVGALATWDRASGLLAARARSRVELRRLLLRKGEPAGQVDRALDRLERAGYLDDADYARQFARSKALGSGMSRRRVQQELGKRGVARELADAAIADVFADEGVDEYAAVERLARKKLPALARLEPVARRRRLYGFLARRGFDADDIHRVLGALGVTGAGDPE